MKKLFTGYKKTFHQILKNLGFYSFIYLFIYFPHGKETSQDDDFFLKQYKIKSMI